jgi:hypothetical protein
MQTQVKKQMKGGIEERMREEWKKKEDSTINNKTRDFTS